MSGDISRAKQRKAAAKGGAKGAKVRMDAGDVANRDKKAMTAGPEATSASFVTKLAFFLLLVVFGVAVSVVVVDYKPGQLREAYIKHLPVEVIHT